MTDQSLEDIGNWINSNALGVCSINSELSSLTSWKIGGKAERLYTPSSIDAMEQVLVACLSAGVPATVIGHGTNVLISDDGIKGLVIVTKSLNSYRIEGSNIFAQAGANLSTIAYAAAEAGLRGLEFAAGIPGTVGGAVIMNAGARGGEINDIFEYADLWSNNEKRRIAKRDMRFRYRGSRIKDNGEIVMEVCLNLSEGDCNASLEIMRKWARDRQLSQPLEFPNAGSVFKNPQNHSAGWYIDQTGLKGQIVGNAQISEKHANFIINLGNAKATDVLELIKLAQEKVLAQFGERLSTEVVFLGFNNRESTGQDEAF